MTEPLVDDAIAAHQGRRCARAQRCADREKVTDRAKACDECDCHSHGGDYPCSVPGGCGHLHAEKDGWLGAQILTRDGLCRICTDHVSQAIRHLPLDVAELTVLMAANGASSNTGKIRSTPTPPIPIRVGIEALRAEIDDELQCWAEPVAERLGIDWDTDARHHSRLGHRVQAAARLLAAAVPTLLVLGAQEQPAWTADGRPALSVDLESDPGPAAWAILERDMTWPYRPIRATSVRSGIDGALHLMELHRQVFAAAGRTKLVHRLTGPCPWCGQRTLTRENGASQVVCESGRCRGREVPERYYDWLAAVVAAEEKRQKAAA